MAYPPIENHGVIGNMRTAALCCDNGTIDWFCFPKFDSPSIFGSILDDKKGGWFSVAPAEEGVASRQFYWPDTNVLVTRFLCKDGVGEVVDFMPVGDSLKKRDVNYLLRMVNGVTGHLAFHMECNPAFDYGRAEHTVSMHERGARFDSTDIRMSLESNVDLIQVDLTVMADFQINEGDCVIFVLRQDPENEQTPAVTVEEVNQLFEETVEYWRNWLSKCTYQGRWREVIYRSALALKLMTYEPTGAIIAAPTSSLPEDLGGVRNWDYRFTWIRDAAFVLYALLRIGFTEEARAFIHWLDDRIHELEDNGTGPLQLMYRIDGGHDLHEETLDHLEGYRGSAPVRIGNKASEQLQIDIYGELLDAIYLYNKYGEMISYDLWLHVCKIIEWLADNWQRKDHGIWEIRGEERAFVYSRVMSWVAVDRALRLADKRSFPADRVRWLKLRDEIYQEIMECGWNEERQAFVQYYGSDDLDASNLIMPLVFFMSPTDPRMLKTLDATLQSPKNGGLTVGSLVYRYDTSTGVDGLEGDEGTFNMCTFWLVEALTRAGRVDEARLKFERMLTNANHLGLYAEQTGEHGEALGNFPQAFTHLSLISAAFNLDRALNGSGV
jgi:GH15 family glucan-1,4-alpha-glucosidase